MFLHGVFDGPNSPIKLGNIAPGRVLGSLAKTLPSASESQEPLAENNLFDSVSLGVLLFFTVLQYLEPQP